MGEQAEGEDPRGRSNEDCKLLQRVSKCCGRLRKAADGCEGLWRVVEGCGGLRRVEDGYRQASPWVLGRIWRVQAGPGMRGGGLIRHTWAGTWGSSPSENQKKLLHSI